MMYMPNFIADNAVKRVLNSRPLVGDATDTASLFTNQAARCSPDIAIGYSGNLLDLPEWSDNYVYAAFDTDNLDIWCRAMFGAEIKWNVNKDQVQGPLDLYLQFVETNTVRGYYQDFGVIDLHKKEGHLIQLMYNLDFDQDMRQQARASDAREMSESGLYIILPKINMFADVKPLMQESPWFKDLMNNKPYAYRHRCPVGHVTHTISPSDYCWCGKATDNMIMRRHPVEGDMSGREDNKPGKKYFERNGR